MRAVPSDAALAAPTEAAPGQIPSSATINDLILTPDISWYELDRYYREGSLAISGEHYYENARWVALEQTILHPDFADQSTLEDREFYLQELRNRKFINNPSVMLALLDQLADNLPAAAIAAAARHAVASIDFLPENGRANFKKRHSAALTELMMLGYDRWGEPR